jgi:hypothetical protein
MGVKAKVNVPKGKALSSAAAKILAAATAKGVPAAKVMEAAQQVYAGKGLSPMEAVWHWHNKTDPATLAAGGASPAATPAASQPAAQPAASQATPSLDQLANTPVEGELPAAGGQTKPKAGGEASSLAGRELPSKKTMIGALTASGQYTPQEVQALSKKGIKALGEEYLRFETATANDPSKNLLPDPPEQAAAPKASGRGVRKLGPGLQQDAAADSISPVQKEKGKGKGKNKLERLDDTDDGQAVVQQQQEQPQKTRASNRSKWTPTGSQEAWVERTGANKPLVAHGIDAVARNWPGIAAAGGIGAAYHSIFGGKEDPGQSNYDPGPFSAPMTSEFLDDYSGMQRMLQQPSQQRDLLKPPSFDQMPMPQEPMQQEPPQGPPAGMPPQSTDVIRMLMQRGQI